MIIIDLETTGLDYHKNAIINRLYEYKGPKRNSIFTKEVRHKNNKNI